MPVHRNYVKTIKKCMKPKHTEQEHPNRHSRHGPSDEVQSNGTSSPHSHQTQNTHTKTQHIKGNSAWYTNNKQTNNNFRS